MVARIVARDLTDYVRVVVVPTPGAHRADRRARPGASRRLTREPLRGSVCSPRCASGSRSRSTASRSRPGGSGTTTPPVGHAAPRTSGSTRCGCRITSSTRSPATVRTRRRSPRSSRSRRSPRSRRVTARVRLGVLVLAAGFRPPGLVAKAAATIDRLSGGRLELGLGAGWLEEEFVAFGYPVRLDRRAVRGSRADAARL